MTNCDLVHEGDMDGTWRESTFSSPESAAVDPDGIYVCEFSPVPCVMQTESCAVLIRFAALLTLPHTGLSASHTGLSASHTVRTLPDVADTGNHLIRRIDRYNREVTTIAGRSGETGSDAPRCICVLAMIDSATPALGANMAPTDSPSCRLHRWRWDERSPRQSDGCHHDPERRALVVP